MINNALTARSRVRLIVDRSDSPWLTNGEINGFLELVLNEYIRERVSVYSTSQEFRDDLGGFVRSVTFSMPTLTTGDTTLSNAANSEDVSGINIEVEKNTFGMDVSFQNNSIDYSVLGVSFRPYKPTDEPTLIEEADRADLNVGTLLSLRVVEGAFSGGELNTAELDADGSYPGTLDGTINTFTGDGIPNFTVKAGQEVDILSVDNFVKSEDDPFNSANEKNYKAVKTDDIYWIRPAPVNETEVSPFFGPTNQGNYVPLEQIGSYAYQEGEVLLSSSITYIPSGTAKRVVMVYIANPTSVDDIMFLPSHGREEVCMIAARKILANIGDETYKFGVNEVQQLKGK